MAGFRKMMKEKDAVAKAAGARGGIGAVAATNPTHTQALGKGMRAAGVEPNKMKFPYDKEGARKAATHSKPGTPPGKRYTSEGKTVSTAKGRKKMVSDKIDKLQGKK